MTTGVRAYNLPRLALVLAVLSLLGQMSEAVAKGGFAVSQYAYYSLNKAHELLAEGKTQLAREALQNMGSNVRLNAHERALMWQTHGHIYATEERYEKAAEAFSKSLSFNGLPEREALDTRYNLAQLYMATERFDKALETLRTWLRQVKNPSADAHYLVASAYAHTKRYEKALVHARAATAKRKMPPESWMQLLLFLHMERKDLAAATTVLKHMVERFPNKHYWTQLASAYAEQGHNARALAVLELAYEQGLLTRETELLQLANLFAHESIPLKAARVLQRGLDEGTIKGSLKTWRFLGEASANARLFDEATDALSRAAELSDDGELYVRLAHLQLQEERWGAAVDFLKAALKKGSIRDPGNAHLLMGIASYSAEQLRVAQEAFQTAAGFENSRSSAKEWLKLLDAAKARRRRGTKRPRHSSDSGPVPSS